MALLFTAEEEEKSSWRAEQVGRIRRGSGLVLRTSGGCSGLNLNPDSEVNPPRVTSKPVSVISAEAEWPLSGPGTSRKAKIKLVAVQSRR